MKKSIRFVTLVLALVFLISGTVMVVSYAEVAGADQGVDQGGVDQGGVDQGGVDQGGVDQGGVDQGGVDQGGVDQGGVDQGGDGGQTGYDDGGNTGYDDGGQTGYDSDNYSGQTGYDSGDDYNYNYDSNQNYDPDPLYYGDASNYSYNISDGGEVAAGSVTSNNTLYNSSGMSAEEAAPNEWSEITLDEKTIKTGVSDFSAIKSNTETTDNGDWILYIGYVLLALSALGILYFIVATIAHRKAVQKAERMERRRSPSPSRGDTVRMDQKDRYGRTSHFADNGAGYSRRASAKADTDEVYIPRRAAKKSR